MPEAIHSSTPVPCPAINTIGELDIEKGGSTKVKAAILSTCPVLQVNTCHVVSPPNGGPSDSDSNMFAGDGRATVVGFSSAALAVAAAVAATSSTGVRIRAVGDGPPNGIFAGPTEEFMELCHIQLQMCKELMGNNVCLTVYLRTPESYASGQLELWRIASGSDNVDVDRGLERHDAILHIGSADVSLPKRFAEQALVKHEVVELEEKQALVLPLARGSFLAGLLIVERQIAVGSSAALSSQPSDEHRPPVWTEVESLPSGNTFSPDEHSAESTASVSGDMSSWEPALSIPAPSVSNLPTPRINNSRPKLLFTIEERAAAAKIAQSLAVACIMDQRSLLLQKSSWQKGLRIDGGLEQMRGPLTALRTIGRLLRQQLRKEEMSRDMVEDMLVQGDRLSELIQQLQKVLYAPQQACRGGLDIITGSC
ncbi:hypothetical protein CBR_g52389 [Chara braunii]|uniref:Uncharacterized protein n=1 Tax=Chara braunii TaxID=69332 RepID=A0A388MA37_CHABU|nr:hypothetical protein CBR_g52389 [Chara braunii]|eukprot:GBG91434.1 hypothetical protein CBR_g52389 [Chara braunii]